MSREINRGGKVEAHRYKRKQSKAGMLNESKKKKKEEAEGKGERREKQEKRRIREAEL